MNLYSLAVGGAAIAYTALGTEAYAKLASLFNDRWIVLVFYATWIVLFMLGPMFVMDYFAQNLHWFSLEDRKPGFFLWLAGVSAYLFLLRRKYLLRKVGLPKSTE